MKQTKSKFAPYYKTFEEAWKDIEQLYITASKQGLWFRIKGIGVWYYPDYLIEKMKAGKLLYKAASIELRDPEEHITELMRYEKQHKDKMDYYRKKRLDVEAKIKEFNLNK